MPLLVAQGDGIRSFMGLMLTLIAASYPLILVDEPEAFLHPPQARLLGRKLAEEAGAAQLLAATHDSDFLLGLLDVRDANVTVLRLTRTSNVNHASLLEPERLRAIWNDPILRYSNILDGLFHRGVVVCESDADSRYYRAVLDAALAESGHSPHDLLFTQCGGKHRFPVVIRVLRALDVPARVITDFDFLRDDNLVRAVVEALGGDWALFVDDWRVLDAHVRRLERNPTVGYVSEQITAIFDAAGAGRLSRDDAQRIRDVVKVEDGWTAIKPVGLAGVPAGDATTRCERLLANLADVGIDVVKVGELESWDRTVGGHGPGWVMTMLEGNRHTGEAAPARDFILGVADRFARL